MKNPWIIPVAALAVGAAGGFITGKNTGSPDEAAAAGESARLARTPARTAGAGAGDDAQRGVRGRSVDEIRLQPGQLSRMQGLLEYYSGLSAEQFEGEARKLDGLPFNERMMASLILFGRWAELDPTSAMAFSNTMGFAGAFVKPTILQSWASVDPANAARYYSENPREFAMMGMGGGPGGMNPASIVAAEWARQDAEAAMAWASGLQAGKGQAMTSVISEVAKSDPAKAAGMVSLMDEGDRPGAYAAIARQWGEKDFDAAKAWALGLPADQRDAALAQAISGLAPTDPELAASEVRLMSVEAANQAIPDLVGAWAQKDPKKAWDWVRSNASEEAQRDSMNQLMSVWANEDPAAALKEVESLGSGDLYDRAASAFIMNNVKGNPKEMLELANGIESDRDRYRSIGTTYNRWRQEDPAAAAAAMQSANIPDRMRENLLQGGGGWWNRGGGRGGRWRR